MLIDNKIAYSDTGDLSGHDIKSVIDFIRKYTTGTPERKGEYDIVTGFFSTHASHTSHI